MRSVDLQCDAKKLLYWGPLATQGSLIPFPHFLAAGNWTMHVKLCEVFNTTQRKLHLLYRVGMVPRRSCREIRAV